MLLPLGWTLLRSLPEFPGYWGVDDRLSSFEERWTGEPALMFVVYGPDYRVDAELPLTTGGGIGSYWATQRRGMWLERRNGVVEYAEYQPQLVEEVRRQHPDREAFILVLSSEAAGDRVIPLPASLPAQRTDLELPLSPVALSDLSLGRD